MPENARRRHLIDTGGPWGTGLLLLGVAVTVQGLAYLFADRGDLRGALAWIDRAIPVSTWGILWVLAGLWSIFRALTPPQRHIDVAPPVGVICLWAGIYFAHWLGQGFGGDWTREWTAGVAWLSLAALLISWSRCINPPTGHR
ncbi:MAG: hypothetical protein HOV76_32445 [Hamadaea sp.]|nr:hypothetical protein [Hamadaea sp.]